MSGQIYILQQDTKVSLNFQDIAAICPDKIEKLSIFV